MSLISPKNFLAPVTNAVNLATIIVIALLFGIYRYSGGGVSMSSRKAPAQNIRQESNIRPDSVKIAPDTELENQNLRAPRGEDNNSSLDDLLESQKYVAPTRAQPSGKAPGSSLDDIAKQLGVE
jgi:hypothetical protein